MRSSDMAHRQLAWLPVHPGLSQAIRSARALAEPDARWRAARQLAGYDRDMVATGRIERLLDPAPASGFAPVRLALLGSHTLDHLGPAIRVAGAGQGLAVHLHLGGYGLYRDALLRGDAALDAFAPEVILLALDIAAVVPRLPLRADESQVDAAVAQGLAAMRALWSAARQRYGARVIQQTFVSQTPRLAGSNEWLLPASAASVARRLNDALRQAARAGDILLIDLEQGGGPDAFHDPARWHQAKQLVDPAKAPLYGELVGRVLAALAGKARRCLVLDLDNTVWGGVIGDLGVEGIVLGQGSAPGEAFLALQAYAAMLRERGVVLAVCSKNDHDFARSAFDLHPEMLLAYEDIACFTANWSDKPTNLRAISRTLNLGLDSFVFVDDNPAERDIVRRELPEVAVPELPDDVSLYPATIAAGGYFEAVTLTAEDFDRAGDYAAASLRGAAAEASVTDMAGYLASLAMQLTCTPVGPFELARAAQLINKSNQFNLTTRRRSESELAALAAREDAAVIAFRLRDRFGDSGLVSVAILRPDPALPAQDLLIDTWLMSCRVLGRGVEQAVLGVLAGIARDRGCRALVGEYRPTERNGMVAGHYPALGFAPLDMPSGDPGCRFWRLDLSNAPEIAHHIELEGAG